MCPKKIFGESTTTRSEFSMRKHLVVHLKQHGAQALAAKPSASQPPPKGTPKNPLFGRRSDQLAVLQQGKLVSPAPSTPAAGTAPGQLTAIDSGSHSVGYFPRLSKESRLEAESKALQQSSERKRYLRSVCAAIGSWSARADCKSGGLLVHRYRHM